MREHAPCGMPEETGTSRPGTARRQVRGGRSMRRRACRTGSTGRAGATDPGGGRSTTWCECRPTVIHRVRSGSLVYSECGSLRRSRPQGPFATAHSGRFASRGMQRRVRRVAGTQRLAASGQRASRANVDSAHLRWVKCRFDPPLIVNAPSLSQEADKHGPQDPGATALACKPLKRVLAAKAAGAHAVAPNTSTLEALRLMASKEIWLSRRPRRRESGRRRLGARLRSRGRPSGQGVERHACTGHHDQRRRRASAWPTRSPNAWR